MGEALLVPDGKDWTWVLERACPQCGFDTRTVTIDELPRLISALGERWRAVLSPTSPRSSSLAVRHSPDRWSPLEYGCHVRDVFGIFNQRLELMLTSDDPAFAIWDQDATAVAEDYAGQDPAQVAVELGQASSASGARFDGVAGSDWDRPGRRSDGAVFTVASLGRYMVHDPFHHLYDVGALAHLRTR